MSKNRFDRFVSIPHSEFCSFGLGVVLPSSRLGQLVSIPHSEFCSFGLPLAINIRKRLKACFNSPFGILFVRTACASCRCPELPRVSIPHSEFCSFGLANDVQARPDRLSFNSPFGILFVRTCSSTARSSSLPSFNSPFGILFVRTSKRTQSHLTALSLFQFPIRNSVRSDAQDDPRIGVSVPSFQFPIRNSVRSDHHGR